jgi:hypothetical protein
MEHTIIRNGAVSVLRQHWKQLVFAVAAILFSACVMIASVSAATTSLRFTQAELDTNWGPERIAPSGGYSSVATFEGRNDVAKINIDSSKASSDAYYRTEGIKNPKNTADSFAVGGDFGQSVQVDLYLDPVFNTNATRAGLWTLADNGAGGADPVNGPFGIIEFANIAGYEGFRYFDPTVGYKPIAGFNEADYGKWVTLKITLNPETDQYVYWVNGVQVGASASPTTSTYLHSVMLNHRNFGLDPQIGLTTNSYSVHWHGGVTKAILSNKEDCKNNGWKTGALQNNTRTFKNQGDCVSYFATNGKNQPASDKRN